MADLPLWTAEDLVAASGGKIVGDVRLPLNGVSIDTRTISLGDIFVAIKGENHDAHDFVPRALAQGAGLAQETLFGEMPVFVVLRRGIDFDLHDVAIEV